MRTKKPLTIFSLALLLLYNSSCSPGTTKEREYLLVSSADNSISGIDYKEPKEAKEELQRQVNQKLIQGYHLVGGVAVVRHPKPDVYGVVMYQAVAK